MLWFRFLIRSARLSSSSSVPERQKADVAVAIAVFLKKNKDFFISCRLRITKQLVVEAVGRSVMASAEQRASSTGSGSPALASDGNDSFSSAASSDDHNGFSVTCTIRPSLVGRGTECRGSTLEELKAAGD